MRAAACVTVRLNDLVPIRIAKKEGVGVCEDQTTNDIDQRLLLLTAKKHGKPNLRFCNTPPSNPKYFF